MIKKILITNHNDRAVRDTTIGKVYDVTFHKEGAHDAWRHICRKDTLCFIDDKGDKVSILTCDPVYEVVDEEEPESPTGEDEWNTVDWDEIPEDVEAVATFKYDEPSYYKVVDGTLQVQCHRESVFSESLYVRLDSYINVFGDRFHLRPSPITQPTPEPPESTQVESSEVEATTTPEFDWSSVEKDVEAVIVHGGGVRQYFKMDGGLLLRRNRAVGDWEKSYYYQTLDEREKCMCDYWCKEAKFLRRPPATTHPEGNVACKVELDHGLFKDELDLLSRNLTPKEFEWYKRVSAQMREDLLKDFTTSTIRTGTYTPKPPSIHTILQEAQQSILKHHGVTGKVSFTVGCSE